MPKYVSYPVLRSKPTPPAPLIQAESSKAAPPRQASLTGPVGTRTFFGAFSGTQVSAAAATACVPDRRGSLPSKVYQIVPLPLRVTGSLLAIWPPRWGLPPTRASGGETAG